MTDEKFARIEIGLKTARLNYEVIDLLRAEFPDISGLKQAALANLSMAVTSVEPATASYRKNAQLLRAKIEKKITYFPSEMQPDAKLAFLSTWHL